MPDCGIRISPLLAAESRMVPTRLWRVGFGATIALSFLIPGQPGPWATASGDPPSTPCTTTSAAKPDTASQRSSVRILVWEASSNRPREILERQLSRFDEARDDIVVDVDHFGDADEMQSQLGDVSPAGRPDLILMNETSAKAMSLSRLAIPIAQCPEGAMISKDLLPIVRATYSFDGQLAAVPYGVSTPVLIFNEVLVVAAGLDPKQPPQHLDDLRRWSDALVNSGVVPYGLVASDHYCPWFIRQFTAQRGELVAPPHNGHDSTPLAGIELDSPTIVADFEWLRAGVVDGSFLWIGGNPSGFDDLLRLPTDRGEAAITMQSSAVLGDVLDLVDAGTFPRSTVGVSPLPGGGSVVGGGAWWLIDNHDRGRVAAGWSLANWLGAPAQIAELSAATGYVPSRQSALEIPILTAAWNRRPALRVAYDQLAGLPPTDAFAGVMIAPSRELDWELFRLCNEMIELPTLDIAAELEALERRISRLLIATGELGSAWSDQRR